MWRLIFTALAAEPAANSGASAQFWGPLLGAAGMIAVGLITQFGTLRSSSRTAQHQRDQQLDERADRQFDKAQGEIDRLQGRLAAAEKECDEMRAQRDDYRERYSKLRVDVYAAGMDPDNLRRPA